MMRGLIDTLEKHHGVRILNEGVIDAVRLSNRYISGRQLPEKSVSLLDTACARVSMSHAATPSAVEDRRRRVEQLGVAIDVLERETVSGGNHQEKVDELKQQRTEIAAELKELEARWEKEKELVNKVRDLRDRLEGRPPMAKRAPVGQGWQLRRHAETARPRNRPRLAEPLRQLRPRQPLRPRRRSPPKNRQS